MMFRDKVVVITGASSGIGAQMAEQLGRNGARVVLLGRSSQRLQQIKDKIGSQALALQLDVTNSEQVDAVMSHIQDRFSKIDVLINNAGFARFESFEQADLNQFETMMDVNYLGVVRCTKAVLPAMLSKKQGHIINIASLAGKVGSAKSTGYSASKHAVLGLTNSLRQELAGSGIHISAVNPGPIDTPFFDQADPTGEYLANMPKWFILQPEYVAAKVLDLISKPRPEINLPRVATFGVKLIQLFPALMDRMAAGVLNRK